MSAFTPDAAAMLDGRTEDRRRAADAFASSPMPRADAEEWRYSPIDELDLSALQPALAAGPVPEAEVATLAALYPSPAALVVLVDGFLYRCDIDAGWAAKGLEVLVDPEAFDGEPDVLAGSALEHLHQAFSPAPIQVRVRAGRAVPAPVVVLDCSSGTGTAAFPHLDVDAGPDAEVTVIQHRISGVGHGLTVPLVRLRAAPAARLRYVEVQDLQQGLWQIGRQVSQVEAQASLVSAMASFGGSYARVRSDCRLTGRGASAELLAAYYGDGDQTVDFRTFQHHEAPDTSSDLLFKGALDERSKSVYSGLIRIHTGGAGSNAFQTNRNVKLSDDAWAWSVPNLEIENNNVRCSHASTVSPVDAEQRFYLHSRGVPPAVADRLIVAGFFDEVLRRLPSDATRRLARARITEKLDKREER